MIFTRAGWARERCLSTGKNPYSDEVTREIQMGMYGRLAGPDEDQVAFAYPLYAAYAAAPLVLLPVSDGAGTVDGAVGHRRGGGRVWRWQSVNRIPLTPITLALVLVGVLVFYPSVRGIFLGQYALLSFACVALAMLAIARGNETGAGILLALSAVKPQPIVLLLPVDFVLGVVESTGGQWCGAHWRRWLLR